MRSKQRSALLGFLCLRCGAERENGHAPFGCPACRDTTPSPLVARYDYDALDDALGRGDEPGIWRYSALLPIRDPSARTSLHEGSTPLLGPYTRPDGGRLWIKNESMSPTWSYKDRLAAVGVSAAREAGASTVAASSSGNHGAAVAAYAAAAGIASVVFTNNDVSRATLTLIQALGSRVVQSTREGRRRLLIRGVESGGWYPLSSLTPHHVGSPYAIEGYKTIAYELAEQLENPPDAVAVPTCYGEGLAGIAAGFTDLVELGRIETTPRLISAEAALGAPLHRARAAGRREIGHVEPYETIAQSIAGTTSSQRALTTLYDTDGLTVPVTDPALVEAQRWLGATAGIFGEPSGVAGLAAVRGWSHRHEPLPENVVVIMTGGGLRTAELIAGQFPDVPTADPEADIDEVMAVGLDKQRMADEQF